MHKIVLLTMIKCKCWTEGGRTWGHGLLLRGANSRRRDTGLSWPLFATVSVVVRNWGNELLAARWSPLGFWGVHPWNSPTPAQEWVCQITAIRVGCLSYKERRRRSPSCVVRTDGGRVVAMMARPIQCPQTAAVLPPLPRLVNPRQALELST